MAEKIIMQFVRGELDFSSFYDAYRKDEKILRYLEDAVASLCKNHIPVTYDTVFRADRSSDAEYYIQKSREDHTEIVVPNQHFPTVKSLIDFFINSDCGFVMKRAEIYDLIFSIVVALEPNTRYYHKYSDDFKFFLRAVPDYVAGGEAACDYIEKEIVATLPPDLSEAQRIKLCKEKIKECFHIAGNRYPHWVQSAEWPILHGEPARYLGYRRTGDLVRYLFEDVVTGNEITIEQCR